MGWVFSLECLLHRSALIFDVASKLAGVGFRYFGQPALDPLDLSIVI